MSESFENLNKKSKFEDIEATLKVENPEKFAEEMARLESDISTGADKVEKEGGLLIESGLRSTGTENEGFSAIGKNILSMFKEKAQELAGRYSKLKTLVLVPTILGALEGGAKQVQTTSQIEAPGAKIIVHDKNDPRLKEYNERLRLNKKYLSTKLSELAPPSSPGDPTKKIIKTEKISYDDAPNDPGSIGSFDKFDKNSVDDPVRGFVHEKEAIFGKDSIKPSYFKKLTIEVTNANGSKEKNILYVAVYDKPTQKVIYEESKPEDTVIVPEKEIEKPNEEKLEQKEVSPGRYSTIDKQTKFILGPNGKTKVPYIERTYYTKSDDKVSRVEKIDPVTHKSIFEVE